MNNIKHTDIFLHLVKTGGQSLSPALNRIYKSEEIYAIDDEDFRKKRRDFIQLPQSKRNQYGLIRGHMFYGLHEHIENPCRYFCIIRNPKDRIISLYNYLYNHRLFPEIKERNLSFKTFLTEGITDLSDNGITRFISGIDIDEVPYGACNEIMLEKAKENIKNKFCLIGDITKYDETLIVLKELLGWKKDPYYDIMNVTKTKIITAKEVDFDNQEIFKYIHYDIKLYEFIIDYFAPVFESHEYLIKNRLASFRIENESFQTKWSRNLVKGVKKLLLKLYHYINRHQ